MRKLALKNKYGFEGGIILSRSFIRVATGHQHASVHHCQKKKKRAGVVFQYTGEQNYTWQKKYFRLVSGAVMGVGVDFACVFFQIAYSFSIS